jgi:large subunit ribosomal protein L13
MLQRDPERALRAAIRGMLPHNVLGRGMLRKLKVYGGPEHPHQAQGVESFELPHLKSAKRVEE